ncbi:MAG TPA: peptide ABC transporter substrate-binding protein [Ktedonobacteraceae bacterium]
MLKRPKRSLLMLSVICLSLLAMILSACGAQGTVAPTSTAPVKGGTWIDEVPAAPGSLLPQGSDTTYSVLIDQAIYTPLFYGDPLGQVHPGLVTEIPTVANGGASADLKTWTFKFRSGLKWSDGQPLDARDLAYSFKTWNDPTFGEKFTSGFADVVSTDVSADNLSLTMHLDKPIGPFVANFVDANPGTPLPMHVFSSMKPADILKTPDGQLPHVTSGPFMIDQANSTSQQVYTVVRNPNYYQAGLPYLDKIVFRIANDPDTILKDAQAGQITSSWFIDISKIDAYKAIPGYTAAPDKVSAGFEALWMNENNPALKDVNVRHAIALAIDHDKLISVARNGLATKLCTDHPSSVVPGYQANAPCPAFDPAAANTLLDQSGWVKGSDGVRAKGALRLDFKYTTTTLAWRKTDQVIVQQDLQAIGIKTTLVNQPGSTFFSTTLPQGVPGVYDIGEFEQTFSYDADDSGNLQCSAIPTKANSYAGGNYAFYCNKTADALFNQELSTTDPAVRQDAFNKLHQIYLTDFPFITEYAPVDATIVKNTAHNYASGPEGAQETVNVWNWWCTAGTC